MGYSTVEIRRSTGKQHHDEQEIRALRDIGAGLEKIGAALERLAAVAEGIVADE